MVEQQFKILLIEDDPNLGYIIQENLEEHGFQVIRCAEGEEGKLMFFRQKPALCLLDVMLPKKDGFTLASEIREVDQETPIIFLTAKSLKEDRIEGFKLGGDDYITKPFSIEELVLRIYAILKRSSNFTKSHKPEVHEIGKYKFDHAKQILSLGENNRKLTDKESELLNLLCSHKNSLLERELALNMIWGENNFFNGRSMDVFVSRLRKYLSEDDHIEIVNVHGRGFKLILAQ